MTGRRTRGAGPRAAAPRRGGRHGLAVALVAVAALLAGPVAGAAAAPPPNDAPAAAAALDAVTAENGPVAERQGVADLAEATADAGVAPCLGKGSFERAVWFRVPASPTPARVSLDAFAPSGDADETPDLAAYVQPGAGGAPVTAVAQACDGAAAKQVADTGASVALDVPAGRDVLVQVGRSAGAALARAVLVAGVDALPAATAAPGDLVAGARAFPLGRARLVPLGAATLTEEDPAQPACPAAGTVWRRVAVTRSGVQVAAARGAGVGALTVFVGRRPTAGNARACGLGAPAGVEVPFRARRGQRAWIRVGTTGAEAPTARLAVSGPCDQTPLRPVRRSRVTVRAPKGARRARAVRLRLTLRGPCVRRARVTVRQRGAVVARGRVGTLTRGARVVRVRRAGGRALRRGTATVVVRGTRFARRAATVRLR